MKKQISNLLAVFLLVCSSIGCEQNDVDELQLENPQIENVKATGGGAGGDDHEPDDPGQ